MPTLTQVAALGMPVGRILKTSAEEVRTTRQRPFISFPAIFAVLQAPEASRIGGALRG